MVESNPSFETLLDEWLTWFDAAFPDATAESYLLKAREEATEFLADPSLEEMSDLLMTLFGWLHETGVGLGDFIAASATKLELNRERRWQQLSDGRYRHMPDEA